MNLEPLPVHQNPALLDRPGVRASQARNKRRIFESHSGSLPGFKGNLSDLMRKYVKPRTNRAFPEECSHRGPIAVRRLVNLVHGLVIALLPSDPPLRYTDAKGALRGGIHSGTVGPSRLNAAVMSARYDTCSKTTHDEKNAGSIYHG